jgi:hypothetical protein
MDLVKTSISLSEWHEKSFWAQYNDYLEKIQGVSSLTYKALQKLAQIDKADDVEAFENGRKVIAYRFNELAVKRAYFVEINHEHNGTIGLQFLQTEALLDMIECARVYDASLLRDFCFLPKAFSDATLKQAKYKTITKALSLAPGNATTFFSVYSRYEQECEDILGEQYDLYELFSVEASDFTPAVCKNNGYNLLTLMDREIKLKEKYFNEMNTLAGPSLAARFLAWEDYYSVTCKMSALVSAP